MGTGMILNRVLEPSVYPISLDEAKLFLGVTDTAKDSLITMMIAAATRDAENKTQRAFITQVWEKSVDAFINEAGNEYIELSRPPIQSIVSVAYTDPDGAPQVVDVADYYLDMREPGRLIAASGSTWPSARDYSNSVVIQYTAGFGYSPDSVPADIKAWILFKLRALFDQTAMPEWADGLLDVYRIHTLA